MAEDKITETEEEVKDEEKQEEEKPKKKRSILSKRKKDKSKEKIVELEAQVAESKDKYLRLFAEFENFKKRNTKERIEMIKSAGKDVIKELLPVLDDFDRAKKTAEDDKNDEVFPEGVTLIYQKINKVLEVKGLTKMKTNGESFDPEIHEAITEIPAPSEDMKGKIIDTIETGYYLNDKIIRFPKVVVGK